jgi:hypothetical protein
VDVCAVSKVNMRQLQSAYAETFRFKGRRVYKTVGKGRETARGAPLFTEKGAVSGWKEGAWIKQPLT